MSKDADSDDSSDGEYRCPKCGRSFETEHGLKNHYGQAHELSPRHIAVEDLGRLDELIHCPWDGCNRVFYDERGLKTHHKTIHGESIAGIDTECAQCGKPLVRMECQMRRSENHFCSDDCQGEWQSEHRRGDNSPTWVGAKIEAVCEYCGTDFERYRSQLTNPERPFCSPKCLAGWRSEHKTGPNAPRWFGGVFPYGEGWTVPVRERIRERQDRQCAGCGVKEADYGRKLDVHHIQPARSFDDAEKRNHPDNLVALCRKCHKEWEHIAPLRPQTEYFE